MRKSYFVSDLHLMANRSAGDRYLVHIERAAAAAMHFVFGGDIFDFRWATTRSAEEAIERAEGWLARLVSDCPECRFHFVLGNHDYHEAFIHRLDALHRRCANLDWHRFFARLGGSVFLHGDVADRMMTAQTLAAHRSRWLHHKRRGPMMSRLYDLVVLAGLHKPLPHIVYPKRRVARRILRYLDDVGHGPSSGVRNVYFGHVHRTFSEYRYGGVTFHNGGAPIKGLRFRIVEAVV